MPTLATTSFPLDLSQRRSPERGEPRVLLACPDARPPAYEAAAGFAQSALLDRFETGFFFKDSTRCWALARQWFPCAYSRWRRVLRRRFHDEIPADRVVAHWSYDAILKLENRLSRSAPRLRRLAARCRTDRFDRQVQRAVLREQPDVAFVFSDVASRWTLPTCRRLGIPSILSMVHGDVREERLVLAQEAERSPDFFPLYLSDGPIDWDELHWLHERRLADIELADRILVPSEHIAGWLVRHGTPWERIRVVPYAADTNRFRPMPGRSRPSGQCTFLFAGGITQRKGIKYLLEAWRRIRRPGWRLQLLGGLPVHTEPLEPYRDEVDWLGRVGHQEVPALMAAADVFVFPSLFEGSAVVTYEALASGLPSIVTPSAGSVVRDHVDGLIIPPAEVEPLAVAMEKLGADPELRAFLGRNARSHAESFDWSRYQASLVENVRTI